MTVPIMGLGILGTLVILFCIHYARKEAQCHAQKEFIRRLIQDNIDHNAKLEADLDSHEFVDHMVKYHSQTDDLSQRALCFEAVKKWILEHGKISTDAYDDNLSLTRRGESARQAPLS
jgi:hypothetical protein